ncbi:hypothetical protein LMG23992_01642 [Cupriavidus laharis]|uniref:Uncharacterized protein n=1 Tax=Cupriavidus laharis TaxID=151654 RepID=A0ABM8WSZ5_9BURK|nr:hypothetical protein LMG23992_01642 [Cupriavidus laharis]
MEFVSDHYPKVPIQGRSVANAGGVCDYQDQRTPTLPNHALRGTLSRLVR